MKLILVNNIYEQEIKPLVKAFFQNEELITELYSEYNKVPEQGLFVVTEAASFRVCMYINSEPCGDISEEFVTENIDDLSGEHRRKRRNQLCRAIYRILSGYTKTELPWGILTGVRPTKLVYECLEKKEPQKAIEKLMKEEYYCSDEKLKLSCKVAQREMELLNRIDYKSGYSIYIGIPFCPTTCHYCSFTSFPLEKNAALVEPYLESLKREITYTGSLLNKKLDTIYFGGGTPTTLSAKQLEDLLSHVRKSFNCETLSELTVEAGRPDSITKEKLRVLKDMGVSRISINPQTMNDKTLERIGRRHTAAQIDEAFSLAREEGFDNINMDIIIGLSGETVKEVTYTLDRIKALNPDSLTVHTLALKRAARLNIEGMRFTDLETGNVGEMLKATSDFAKAEDYQPYYLYRQKNMSENLENVGYARYDREGIYNILIMEEKQTILAMGAGASSKFVFHDAAEGVLIERVENVKNLRDYITRTDEMIARKKQFFEQYGGRLCE